MFEIRKIIFFITFITIFSPIIAQKNESNTQVCKEKQVCASEKIANSIENVGPGRPVLSSQVTRCILLRQKAKEFIKRLDKFNSSEEAIIFSLLAN